MTMQSFKVTELDYVRSVQPVRSCSLELPYRFTTLHLQHNYHTTTQHGIMF